MMGGEHYQNVGLDTSITSSCTLPWLYTNLPSSIHDTVMSNIVSHGW
jgi:hypothetical protein